MRKLITVYFYFITSALFAQPKMQWQKTYGGSQFDQPFGCEATRSGGIICGGHSLSTDSDITLNQGDYDWWIVKLDKDGNKIWSKTFGGSAYDKSRYAMENPDGTVMAFGSVRSTDGDVIGNHGNNDYWLLKLDSMGNIIWKKTYGGTSDEGGRSVIRTSDGNHLMAGYTHSFDMDVTGNHGNYDVWLVKVSDVDGSIIWKKCYGGSNIERVRSIVQLKNGNFVFTGNSESIDGDLVGTVNQGGEDFWTACIDSTGNLLWSVKHGSAGQDRAYFVTQDLDDNILVVGKDSLNSGDVSDNHGQSDVWILKLNQVNGSLIWKKSFGGSGDDEGFRIDPNPDGGYVVAATSESKDGDSPTNKGLSDYWVFKIDSNRNIVWSKNFGGGSWDHMNDIVRMSDGGYAGIGFSSSKPGGGSDKTVSYGSFDMWIVKIVICDSSAQINANGSTTLCAGNSVQLSANNGNSYLWNNGQTTQSISVNAAGTYSAAVTNLFGCVTQSNSINVKLISKQIIAVGSLIINPGDSVILNADTTQNLNYLWSNGATSSSIKVTTAGTFYVTITNSISGCVTHSDSVTVTLNNCTAPAGISANAITNTSVKIIWTPISGVAGYKVAYRKTGTTAWTTKSYGKTISSASLTGLLSSTSYQYKIKTKCSSSPVTFSNWSIVKKFTTLSIRSSQFEETERKISIYPNPVSDNFLVSFSGNSNEALVIVHNILGEKIFETKAISKSDSDFELNINSAHFVNGIYFLQVECGGEIFNSRFTKQ